jgi:tetratricopeptide (TPR) repeat protein/transcriptional regulator with XRE-family HTH domain
VTEQNAPGFAGLLRELRADVRLTQEELATAAGLSTRTVSDLERGITQTAHQDTARLLAEALGLTALVRTLFIAAARGRLPASHVLAAREDAADLGTVTVADPAEPVVTAPAGRPVPRELPADVAAFTGRAAELARLDELLAAAEGGPGDAQGPVVISAVSGTAGVGKTALAVRWAHRVADAFPDGQLYVDLRGYDPGQPMPTQEALASFLRALGVASQDIPLEKAERAARYRSVVAGKRLLVLLDNAATEEQVRPLLPGTATALVLITSRDSLAGLVARDGARRLDLDLLPDADAVALLHTLIGARIDDDPAAAQTLAGQCARLPLALRVAAELACTRPDMPLAKMTVELAGLQDRLDLLAAGGDPRGAVASVFSWSYRHLPPDAARMFRLLGLHPGTHWDHYAAAALTGFGAARSDQLLGVLARAHLIQPARAGRYGMHDLLRAYADALAVSDDTEDDRHAALTALLDYYLAAAAAALDLLAPAERHYRPEPLPVATPVPEFDDQRAARAWLDTELATLTIVAAYATSHGWPGHTVRLAVTLKRYLYGGHDTDALAINGHALDAARACGDRTAEAAALISLGVIHARQGRAERAAEHHGQALALARDNGDLGAQAAALTGLAFLHDWQRHYQQAAHCQRQALALYRQQGDRVGQAGAAQGLGVSYFRQGRYQQAASYMEQALALSREVGDQHGEVWVLVSLGDMCYQQSRYDQAADHLREAVAVSREIGDRYTEAEALTHLGGVSHRRGQHSEAVGYYQQALALYRAIGGRDGEADALNGAGETLLAVGQVDEAADHHATALGLARQTGNLYQQALALSRLGAVRTQQSRYEEAVDYNQQAVALFRQTGDRAGESEALNGAGETLLASGQPAQARPLYSAALTLARRTGERYQQARAHQGLAGTCQAAGQPGRARQHRQQALDIYLDLGVPLWHDDDRRR